MNSLQIREFEDKCEKILGYPISIYNQNGNYQINVVFDKKKFRESSYDSSFCLISFTDNPHRNCGMSILSNLIINYSYQKYDYRKDTYTLKLEYSKETVAEIFKGFLRLIYPHDTNKHSYFTFQAPNREIDTILTDLGFKKLADYKNYNHRTEPNRWIWVLEIPDYKGLDEKNINPKKVRKAPAKKATKPVVRRVRKKAEVVV